ncbi:protein of unknown function [Burkholderia multivorans]
MACGRRSEGEADGGGRRVRMPRGVSGTARAGKATAGADAMRRGHAGGVRRHFESSRQGGSGARDAGLDRPAPCTWIAIQKSR